MKNDLLYLNNIQECIALIELYTQASHESSSSPCSEAPCSEASHFQVRFT